MRRKISVLLVIVLLAGCMPAFASETVSREATVEGSIFGGRTDDRIAVTVSFDPGWLIERDNRVYDPELAQFSALLCADSYFREKDLAKSRQNRVLFNDMPVEEYSHTSFLSGVGFTEVGHFESAPAEMDPDDTVVLNIGHMTVGEYDVYAIVIRGSFSAQEWRSAFDPGCENDPRDEHPEWTDKADHKGANVAANRALACITEFMERTGDPALPDRVLLTGHSRGGGIANLLGARFEKQEGVTPYTYTFDPLTVTTAADAGSYETVFNVFDTEDFFAVHLPIGEGAFCRYGKDLCLSLADSDGILKMLAELKGREDYACISAEAAAAADALFRERFPDRDMLLDTVTVTRVYATEAEAAEDRETCLQAIGASGFCIENLYRVGEIVPTADGCFSVQLEYCGKTILKAYAMLLAYGESAHASVIRLFAEDETACRLADLLLENAAGLSAGHLLVNSYVLAGTEWGRTETRETVEAVDLTARCNFETKHAEKLTDVWLKSYNTYPAGYELKINWRENVPVRSVYLQFSLEAVPYTVSLYRKNGELISSYEGTQYLNNLLPVTEDTVRIVIRAGEKEMRLCNVRLYSEGTVPGFHPWDERASKVDLMIVATHPDDDVLFLGAVIPLYQGNGDKTSVEVLTCSAKRTRHEEGLNGAWCLGSRQEPVFLGYPDMSDQKKFDKVLPLEDLTVSLVRQIRRFRPEVVVSQDKEGEYGHWQHKRTVEAVRLAVEHAPDPAFDPESAEQYGAWQVKKLYLHLFEENPIRLDVLKPLENLDGLSAMEVADKAFRCHTSQLSGRHSVQNEGIYDLAAFGLAYSAVGSDTPGLNDMFEHILPAEAS